MRIDDQIAWLFLEKANERAKVELLDCQTKLVAAPPAGARLVEQVVEVSKHVRGAIDEIEIRLAVKPAERNIGQFQDVHVFHAGLGHGLAQREFHGLGRPKMAGPDRCGQNKNAWG